MNDGPTEQKNDRMLDLSTNQGAWFLGTDVSMRKELWHVRPPVWISHAWLKVVQRWFGSACKLRGDQLGTLWGERTCIFSSSFWPYFWIQTEDIGRVELLNYATYSVRSKLCYELRLCTCLISFRYLVGQKLVNYEHGKRPTKVPTKAMADTGWIIHLLEVFTVRTESRIAPIRQQSHNTGYFISIA